MYLVISLFEGRIWDLIVSVPDHCLSFYFFSCRAHISDVPVTVQVNEVLPTPGISVTDYIKVP